MIKLVIFDLDGVLVDTKQIHFEALNEALKQLAPDFIISEDEHYAIYDGLPTEIKLKMLSEKRIISIFTF